MGWPWGWRRATAVAGATSVVIGFVGTLVVGALLPPDAGGTTLAGVVGLMLLVPLGFVLMWEALITWPREGSPYPWNRRVQGATAVLAALGVIVLTQSLAAHLLPHTWWVGVLVVGLLGWMGLRVFRLLRPRPALGDTQVDA